MEECRNGKMSFSFKGSEDLNHRFGEFCQIHEVSPAMILSASIGILLYRYSGEVHVSIGARAKSNGSYKALDIDLEDSPAIRDLLRQVCEKMNGVSLVCGDRESSIEYLFPLHLIRHLMCESNNGMEFASQGPLNLACEYNASGLGFVSHYEGTLFTEEMIAQMAGHLLNLLKEMIENADSKCSDLQMLGSEEIHKIIYEWNCPTLEYEHKCFQELFDEQVAKNPDLRILLSQNRSLTYAELNSYANSVAGQLRQLGVKTETIVGIGMGRSFEAIICIVGVLKTGAAYCVIDPDYPVARIEQMAHEAETAIVLTKSESAARFNMSGSRIVSIEGLLNNEAGVENVSCKVKLGNAAYVTFTSGTTGTPKGVIATHRSLAVLNKLGRLLYSGKSSEIFCLNTPLGFSSVASLLMSLCCGFPIAVIPNGLEKDPRVIALAVQQHQVTNLSMMPSFLRQLYSLGDEGKMMLSSVRRVSLSGSEVTWDLVEPFRKMMPNANLTVGYASSETCAIVVGNFVDIAGKGKSERVSLGRPSRAAQVLVLDRNMNLVPIGASGELYVGSAHLARGYINQPALTAECFLPNPFGLTPGERMYRTGDVVKFRSNGELEFIGRSDNQVKIRGFRVEVEEIEAVLTSYSEIEEAAVIVDKNEITERLAAYIVTKQGAEGDTTQLRQYLEQRLPSYMVPSMFVILDRLPMTANGKIDRNALQSIPANSPMSSQPYEAASDPIQETLVEIWETTMGVSGIGINDEYLSIGGDSLIAAMIVMSIQERFGVEIPLPLFFEGLTIKVLAVEISRIKENGAPSQVASDFYPLQWS
jgi:amino acid adenylation domain-containing protein